LSGLAKTQRFNEAFAPVITLRANAPELSRESARKGRHKELAASQAGQNNTP
jgi:hypothetical protein